MRVLQSTKDRLIKKIEHNKLEQVDFRFTGGGFAVDDWIRLTNALKSNDTLTHLDLGDCNISESQLNLLINSLEENNSLIEVSIESFRDDSLTRRAALQQLESLLTRNKQQLTRNSGPLKP